MSKWTTADIPDQTGRVAVITGANTGLGYETALALAEHGAHVVLAVRNLDKGKDAAARITADGPRGEVALQELDLTSLESVRAAARELRSNYDRIDLLINNAGVMWTPKSTTSDGFELQFGTNHLGHFAFTGLLLDRLLPVAGSRIVTVSSMGHRLRAAIHFDDLQWERRYDRIGAYGQAKLANFHFGLGLDRRLREAGGRAASLIAHPGLSNTELQAVSVEETGGGLSQRFFLMLARTVGMSPGEGALSQLRAATDPGAKGGEFYGPLFVNSGPPVRKPILRRLGMNSSIERLWEVSERETGLKIEA